jgi:hypothetical protein
MPGRESGSPGDASAPVHQADAQHKMAHHRYAELIHSHRARSEAAFYIADSNNEILHAAQSNFALREKRDLLLEV